jgi:E3 ubiquitin-protein ligase HERC2
LQAGEKVLSLVYAFGCNQAGQLGIGKLDTKESIPVLVDDLKSVEVAELAAGGWNSMLRTGDGEVYTCGDGENGKLGHPDITHEQLTRFRIIEKLKRENCTQVEGHVSRVALGRDHACAITSEGHMYTWGNGDDGKLGHQDMGAKKLPQKISALRELEQPISDIVSLGHTFTMCIAIDNILMTCGGNNCGQLATGDNRGKWVPQLINPDHPEHVGLSHYTKNTESTYDITEPIKELYAGKAHGVALTKTGHVWTWGSSVQGQTGMGEEKADPDSLWARNYKNLVRPKLVPGLTLSAVSINFMCVGSDHCLAFSSEGELWGWGANNFGQLGLGSTTATIWNPTKIDTEDILGYITQLSAGDAHSGCVTNIGDIYTWGDGREGQLGHGSFESVSKPKLVKFTRDPEAAGQTPVLFCGGFHSFISIRKSLLSLSIKTILKIFLSLSLTIKSMLSLNKPTILKSMLSLNKTTILNQMPLKLKKMKKLIMEENLLLLLKRMFKLRKVVFQD